MKQNLPKGWIDVQLSNIVNTLETGNRPKGGVRGITAGIPSVGGEHLNSAGGFDFNNIKYVPSDFYHTMKKGHIRKDDILVVKDGATTGKTSFVTNTFPYEIAVINEHVFLLRCSKHVCSSYIFRYLWSRAGQSRMLANFQGAAQGGMNRIFLTNTLIPLPPLREQKCLADKLDHIIPKIDTVEKRLERIPKIIKRFRQSVLMAAVTGKLTESWRENHPEVESALDIIKSIMKKRLEALTTNSKMEKTREIYNLKEINNSDGLPNSWKYSLLNKICQSFQYGTSRKSQKEGKIPVLRMGNLQNGKIDWNDLAFSSDEKEIEKYMLKPGDVLFNRTNSAELVGKTAIFLGEQKAIYAGYLIRINNYDKLDSKL